MNERELLAHYRPWLRGMAVRMTSHPDEVDDVASEGWIALWKALPTYDGGGSFDSWCKSVMHNGMRRYFQHWSYACRDVRRVDYVGGPEDLDLVAGAAECLDTVAVAYHHGEVAAAVDALPATYREYVIKRFWQGYTTTELQRAMSPSTWTRVKKRLAAELAHLAGAQ